jgi:hypothetical protein
MLEQIGVRPEQKVVIDPLSHYSSDPEMVAVTGYAPNNPITRTLSMTFYPGIRFLQLMPPAAGVRTSALFESSKDSYTKSVSPVEARQIPWEPRSLAGREAPAKPGPRVLAAASEGHLPASATGAPAFRAIVIGDGDFASNSFLPYMANSDLALSMIRWLVSEEHSQPITSRIPVPPMILLTQAQTLWIFLVIEVLLPLAVISVGAGMWWRHR